jgi:hypothetical protein
MAEICHKSEIRKSDIFLFEGVDGGAGVLPDASAKAAVMGSS